MYEHILFDNHAEQRLFVTSNINLKRVIHRESLTY